MFALHLDYFRMLKQIVAVCVFASLLPQFLNWYYCITINKPNDEYDFIIVGAGTTGNVIANRLTESPNVSVLVLEAGDNAFPNPLISVPMFVPLLQQSATDWMYRTEPQERACKLLRNKISYWAKGKVIGGSSCLNYMLYVRGSKYDYDTWENEGALGWNYNSILPYFKKSEMAMNDDMSSDYHGKHGILKTGYSYMTPIAKLVLEAGKELGYKQRDYNGEDMIGIHQAQNTVYNGWRQSSNEFLKQAAVQRPERLHIVGRAHVRQIVFEADTNGVQRATGVIFVRDGVEVNVRARKEVILSAGSVGSPQLLLLSGIGPKKHLKEKEIPVIADLPGVGRNLQDHVMTPALFYGPNVPPRSSIDDYTIFTAMPQYLIGNGGPLSYSGLDVTSFIRTSLAKSKSPDIQITQLSAQLTLGSLDLNERLFNFGPEFLESLRKKATGRGGDPIYNFLLAVTLLKPSSVGEIKLKTNNYKDHPLIQPNYLSSQIDVDKMIEGLRVVERLEGTKVFRKMKLKMDFTSMGCGNETDPPRSAKFYECLIRSLTWTVFHPVGTAKMGSPDDDMAVVNPRLKVYKVDGLRVADASVMPTIPSANTQAACYMIGEKAADMIKQDWKLQIK